MSCTFGFNLFAIFDFYKKITTNTYYKTLQIDIIMGVLWSSIYSLPTLLVILIGALLSQKVRKSDNIM